MTRMRNHIEPGTLKEYDGQYATVALDSYEDELFREEVILLGANSKSQNLPFVNDKVLLVWDAFGECYMLAALLCEQQTRPQEDTLERVSDNGFLSVRTTAGGKVEIKNSTAELITILHDLVSALEIGTTPTMLGPQLMSTATATFTAVKTKLESMKV